MEKEFLFSNSRNPNLLRYFRLGEEWHESFVVEFTLDANCYGQLYWGNCVYVEEDRRIISEMLTIAFLPDSHDEWKKKNLELMESGIDFSLILKQAEKEINKNIKTNETKL